MNGTVYLNKLTFRIYKFLVKKNWVQEKNTDRFIVLLPPSDLKFEESFRINLPISSNSPDYYTYMKSIIILLQKLYDNENALMEFGRHNENLKNKFTKNWVVPEEKSRIEKIGKNDIYLPVKLKL